MPQRSTKGEAASTSIPPRSIDGSKDARTVLKPPVKDRRSAMVTFDRGSVGSVAHQSRYLSLNRHSKRFVYGDFFFFV